ncbi:hypothetical protein [Teichococcus aestuarii]|uniref:hypothetical protein n=1 Tax=Teichococcus aestuarii TaxID=568898 RepID=UPI00361E81B0
MSRSLATRLYVLLGLSALVALVTASFAMWALSSYRVEVQATQRTGAIAWRVERVNGRVMEAVSDSRLLYFAQPGSDAEKAAASLRRALAGLQAEMEARQALLRPEELPAFHELSRITGEFVRFRTEVARVGVETGPPPPTPWATTRPTGPTAGP